ncbi:unnamed protein product [Phytophthora fragariaefolia]|uniref:Unnamed protein product n=1 Tax=Phytophthora fragariaefolia TaxID=1490495 RepID=A0A9W6WRU1_9STRA|nr:unnamed protein product [Phytophthora fragariaefolia]
MIAPEPPARVKDAVSNWRNRGGFERIPPGGEYSYIDDWGVRVTYMDGHQTKKAFVCMADSGYREATDGRNLILLSGGKTSSAVKHLTTRHHLESPKTVKEVTTKRKRNADIKSLRTSTLYTCDPVRLNLLLETLRIIINNLPLEIVEYEESRLKEALVLRQEVQSTLTRERVNECIIEIYSSTRKELVGFFKSNLQAYPNKTMVAEMWTCKTPSNKFLGLCVYLVDNDWNFKFVLLGTRKFTPAYGDRDGGIQAPFLCWIKRTLEDFELTVDNFYGATSIKGPDVQILIKNRLHYQWEWCMAHMSHAATRASCGMTSGNNSKNPGMSSIIKKMNKVIFEVKHVEVTGDLFKGLCESMTAGKSTTLLSYSDARFLSVTKAMRRVLDKGQAIEAWYDERASKATRESSTPPVFPLAGEFTTLTQLMSILQSLADFKRSCQAEMPTQVENLMILYSIRLNDFDLEKPIRHYLSTRKKPIWIQPSELTPLASPTRRLLQEALDKRFFIRYNDETKMATTSYVFEMQ